MRRALGGAALAAHGLAHALPAAQAGASGRSWLLSAVGIAPGPQRWIVAALATAAMCGLLAAGFGLWGASPFRGAWRRAAAVGARASLVLLVLFWVNAWALFAVVADVAILAALAFTSTQPNSARPREASTGRRRAAATASVIATAFVTWIGLVSLTAPWHRLWGSAVSELEAVLPGDEPLTGPPTYWVQHAVTIDAPPEDVWPWIAQLGTDRGGFYSYAFLERAAGIDVHNADRVHEEWQDVHPGGFVLAAPAGYLGFDEPLGWDVTTVEPGRVMVLDKWGAFVLLPGDHRTTRLIVRTRNDQPPGIAGLTLAWFGLVTFEPAHFIMERRMLLGVKERAEHAAARGG